MSWVARVVGSQCQSCNLAIPHPAERELLGLVRQVKLGGCLRLATTSLPHRCQSSSLPRRVPPSANLSGLGPSGVSSVRLSCLIQDPGAWILDAGSCILVPGSCMLDPGSGIPDAGSCILVPGSWILHPGSWNPDPGSRIKDPGSWIPDPSL